MYIDPVIKYVQKYQKYLVLNKENLQNWQILQYVGFLKKILLTNLIWNVNQQNL